MLPISSAGRTISAGEERIHRRLRGVLAAIVAGLLVALAAIPASAQTVERADGDAAGELTQPLPYRVVGRALPQLAGPRTGTTTRQWPGTYFEASFSGARAGFALGEGAVRLRVTIDGSRPVYLTRPAPGRYRIAGLVAGRHRIRIDIVSEDEAHATGFGGFFIGGHDTALPIAARPRQIEFIGDSFTVGYGNTASSRQCNLDEVWQTTDSGQGFVPQVAAGFDADYQINAISGRGVVRNYAGHPAPTLPEAYPFVLFDQAQRVAEPDWRPQAIVIGLGTNDFSTPLAAIERWSSRAALHADFEERYLGLVRQLRAAHPSAYFLLWATDQADGEIARETGNVVERLKASGDLRVAFLKVPPLQLIGCNGHPGLADHRIIAGAIANALAPALGARAQIPPGVKSNPAAPSASHKLSMQLRSAPSSVERMTKLAPTLPSRKNG